MIVLLIIVVLAVALAGGGVAIYNGLVARTNRVEEAWSQISVQLKRRHDLIPNLVEIAKDYMGYEAETLTAVVEARSRAVVAGDGDRGGAVQAEGLLGAALGRLFAVAEDYPDLKANENVTALQAQLAATEDGIAAARGAYNDSVESLNTMVESFPSNLIAGAFAFSKAVFFEVADSDKEPVKVDLR